MPAEIREIPMGHPPKQKLYRVLSLDGGGAKGFYTLGALKEIEALVGCCFEPGFGCTIADAVVGSCSAYPFFKQKLVTTGRGDHIEVRDGGFVANSPALYAIADVTESLGHARENVRVVS